LSDRSSQRLIGTGGPSGNESFSESLRRISPSAKSSPGSAGSVHHSDQHIFPQEVAIARFVYQAIVVIIFAVVQ